MAQEPDIAAGNRGGQYEGETLEIGVDIKRHEDGWYTSETMSNDTYICQNYRYSQISPEKNVFYFGFDSDWWTIVGDVDISVENVPINGYDPADAITVTRLNRISTRLSRILSW